MTDVFAADTAADTAAPTGFGTVNGDDANGDGGIGDNIASSKKEFLGTMRKLGVTEAKGEASRAEALITLQNAVIDGIISVKETKRGPKGKGAKKDDTPDEVKEAFDAYKDANVKAGKQMTSPAQQLSKFRAAAKHAAGPASWNMQAVRDKALEDHKTVHLANLQVKTKKAGKQSIYSPSQVIINLAHKQLSEERKSQYDTPLTEDEVKACIFKGERQGKSLRDYLEDVLDRLNDEDTSELSEEQKEKLAAAAGAVSELRDSLPDPEAEEAEEEEMAADVEAYNRLIARGFQFPTVAQQ